MALIGNQSLLNKSFQRTYGGSSLAIALHMNNKSSLMSTNILRSRMQNQFNKASIPTGYAPGTAFMMSMKTGELSAIRIDGQATITATALSAMIMSVNAIAGTGSLAGAANAIGLIAIAGTSAGVASVVGAMKATSSLAGVVVGQAVVVANLGAIIPISGAIYAVASAAANLKGTARAAGIISIGASGYLSNNDVERLANAVWDEATASHSEAGTTGKALQDAGSAGNPWSADVSTNNTPGTFGAFVQKLLTLAKFLGLK